MTETFDEQALHDVSALVIDANGLKFCDSSGIRALGVVARACDLHGIAMSLVRVRPSLRCVFEIAGATDLLHVAPD